MSKWDPQPRFDRSQFDGKRPRAVSGETGIAFSDFARMHVQRRAKVQERRLPTPKWALRDEWLRELLVVYLEERFYVTPVPETSLQARLKVARLAALSYAPRKRQLLDNMLDYYYKLATIGNTDMSDEEAIETFTTLKYFGGQYPLNADIARGKLAERSLHNLEIEIQNIDTDLVLTDKGHAEVIASLVYLYYRLGWDSVTVAEQLGLKSPHVRIVLYRLHATWRKHLSHREGRIAEEGQDSLENLQGDQGSAGVAPSSQQYEPLAEIFEGGS